ncbi:MAG: hypothetical protein ACRC8S_17510 [Fimbriiglobus sp.]
MPNGRGCLECCYCEHFRCDNPDWLGYDAVHEAGKCLHHLADLPATMELDLNRICRDFQPNEWFARDSEASAAKRLGWFPGPLAASVLYGFPYHHPPSVKPLGELKGLGQ